MYKQVRERGVIIRHFDLGEADRVYTLLTGELGRITAKARGVKRVSAKLTGSLEYFRVLDLELVEGKNWYTVTGVKVVADWESIRSDLDRLYPAAALLRALYRMVPEGGGASLLAAISSGLAAYDQTGSAVMIQGLLMRILASLGYQPEAYPSERQRKLAEAYQRLSWEQLGRLEVGSDDLVEMEAFLTQEYRQHVGVDLKEG